MKRTTPSMLLAIVFITMTALLLSAQTSDFPWPRYWGPSISSYFKVDDSVSVPLVREVNRYRIMKDAIYLTHRIEDAADNKVYLEFHAGGGAFFDSDDDTIFPAAFISFKINLMNPKIPNSHEIMGDIHELRNLSTLTGFTLPTEASQLMDVTYRRLTKYHSEFWWKRLSLIFSIPFDSPSPSFDYDETFLCLGYDLGDIMTFQFGANLHKDYVGMASVDLSTPLYSLAEQFKDVIARLLRLPKGSSYYGEYD